MKCFATGDLGLAVYARPISLLLVDEPEVTTLRVTAEGANLHRGVPLLQSPVDVREVALEAVQDGAEDDTLLDHRHQLVVG